MSDCRNPDCDRESDYMSAYCSRECEEDHRGPLMTDEDWNDLRRGVASGDIPNPLGGN